MSLWKQKGADGDAIDVLAQTGGRALCESGRRGSDLQGGVSHGLPPGELLPKKGLRFPGKHAYV
jgi:hypothetical protein